MNLKKMDLDLGIMKRWVRVFLRFVGFCIYVLLTTVCVLTCLNAESMIIKTAGFFVLSLVMLPYLLLGGLYGYVISMVSFSISFIFSLVLDMDNSFKMAVFLVPTLCFSLFSQYFWFEKLKKTFLAAFFTVLLTGVIELSCLTIVAEGTYNVTVQRIKDLGGDMWYYMCRDAVVILGCALLLHLFFRYCPDLFKLIFPLGVGYTRAFRENNELRRDLRKTRIGVKISSIIIAVELILGIFVGVFMIALFPDLKAIMISNINQESYDNAVLEQSVDVFSEQDRDEFIDRIENMDYRFDVKALGYDIKMVLMMLCVGVPLAAFAHYYVKITIGMPLGMMSDFLYEYATAPDDEKLEVGKKADRIRVRSRDEIRVVNDGVRATVRSVEEYIGRLQEEQELEKELEVAQKASEAKSSFLSNMSHEIRTPINAVLGMNEMILRESREPQTIEYAQNVKSAGNSLLGIVNDILDFSKIEAGKMDILPVEYHLSSMVNDLINMISVKAEDKGLILEVNVDEHIPNKLFGDEIRIKQCVTNVLTNAVKYTEEGTVTMNVTFRQAQDDNIYLKFQVVDTGIGIKEEDLNKLFSPFERIEEIRNRSIEGTGLGMSIVKKLLAMMDTKLEVKSVYGEGSDFSFEVLQKVVARDEIGDFKEKYKEYLKSLESYHEKFHAPDARILVVDDTPMNLTVVKGLLKSTRIMVDTADSGRETLKKVTMERYDAIFIDHRMPEMDGLQTLAAMKELEGNLNIDVPCIALTANAGSGARDEYLAAGFDDYLAKPVNGEELEDMLRTYLPEDKILPADDTEQEETKDDNAGTQTGESFVNDLEGINLSEALKNCGSIEVLEDVAREFAISIDTKADAIEKYCNEGDHRNYTVLVHALKSSARLIGAMELSGLAAELEKLGNDENDGQIREKTPHLLEMYRGYRQKLSAALPREADEDLPEIPEEELLGAFADLKELLEAYDFDTADSIMKMLTEYRIPKDYREKYDKIKELMAAVDRDALLQIL